MPTTSRGTIAGAARRRRLETRRHLEYLGHQGVRKRQAWCNSRCLAREMNPLKDEEIQKTRFNGNRAGHFD